MDFFSPFDEYENNISTQKRKAKLMSKIAKTINKNIQDCKHDKTVKRGSCTICTDCEELISCDHENLLTKNGENTCIDCGCSVEVFDFSAEWRYYGSADKSGRDASRCHKGQDTGKNSLDKLFQDLGIHFTQSIRNKTEARYKQVCGDKMYRGNKRKAIVAICLMRTLHAEGIIKTSDEIRKMFDLQKRDMSQGLTVYNQAFPQERSKKIKPVDLIQGRMQLIGLDIRQHYKYVRFFATWLEDSGPEINTSNPQTTASAVVYIYLCLVPDIKEKLGMTRGEFGKRVDLTDVTITKLVKKIAKIMGIPEKFINI